MNTPGFLAAIKEMNQLQELSIGIRLEVISLLLLTFPNRMRRKYILGMPLYNQPRSPSYRA